MDAAKALTYLEASVLVSTQRSLIYHEPYLVLPRPFCSVTSGYGSRGGRSQGGEPVCHSARVSVPAANYMFQRWPR